MFKRILEEGEVEKNSIKETIVACNRSLEILGLYSQKDNIDVKNKCETNLTLILFLFVGIESLLFVLDISNNYISRTLTLDFYEDPHFIA